MKGMNSGNPFPGFIGFSFLYPVAQYQTMRCPLCHSKTDAFTEAVDRSYRYCGTCRLISVPPEHLIPENEEKERYLEHENSLKNSGYVKMFMDKIQLLPAYCPKVRTVLDFGCGYETVLVSLLNREGYRAEGFDCFFFPEWPSDKTFDLVISTETFEHLKDPDRELDRIEKILAPSGYLAVMTQFYPASHGEPDPEEFAQWYYQRDPTHIRFYSPETFRWMERQNLYNLVFDNDKDFVILQKTKS